MTIKDSADRATSFAAEKLDQAKTVASDALDTTKDKVGTAYEAARERASEAYEAARLRAADASQATARTVDEQPLVALIGGLALGALVAAVLPRTAREAEVLGPIGSKITGAAKTAASAARDAGLARLDEIGLTPDKARETVKQLVSDAASAATSAGTAAASSVREGAST